MVTRSRTRNVLDYVRGHAHNRVMETLLIEGAIDRHAPDPSAPSDPRSIWLGMVTVGYPGDQRSAAILSVDTDRGTGDPVWKTKVLVLRWIGDPPGPEVAQAVYDLIHDGGPAQRKLSGVWTSQQRTESQSSYRAARA